MKPLLTLLLLLSGLASAGELVPVLMPDGGAGIGFDDLGYAPTYKKVIVPGGRTGRIFLVDPYSKKAGPYGRFSAEKDYQGGHGEGVTSAVEGSGLLFGTDRNTESVAAVDPKSGKEVSRSKLRGHPDYVRFVPGLREVWVSEPDNEKIEIFSLSAKGELKSEAEIAVPGGPEFLLIDSSRGRAYCNTWKDETLAVDLKSRTIAARWNNGCVGSRGLALDENKGFLIVGCEEGKAVVLDAGKDGKTLSTLSSGKGVDVIAYAPSLGHLYLPGADSATMAVMSLDAKGKLGLIRVVATAKHSHCVTADAQAGAWVCDPDHGRMLYLKDESAPVR
jgi:hypothetical protein